MKEVKTPKKPLAIYYTIVLLLLLLLNVVLVPWMNERQIKEVDYGTFMSMTEESSENAFTESAVCTITSGSGFSWS